MDADPEEWLEVKEQSLLKQRVLASHQQFGATLRKICSVTRSTKSPCSDVATSLQAARLLSITIIYLEI
jgi:hypothetical protein